MTNPWDNEPDRKQWIEKSSGFDCLILRHNRTGHLSGYVGVPFGHPFWGCHYDYPYKVGTDVSVHGGLTYANFCKPVCGICHEGEVAHKNVWWMGFDCAHLGDLLPTHHDFRRGMNEDEKKSADILQKIHEECHSGNAYSDVYRDMDYVTTECEELAQQLKSVRVPFWKQPYGFYMAMKCWFHFRTRLGRFLWWKKMEKMTKDMIKYRQKREKK